MKSSSIYGEVLSLEGARKLCLSMEHSKNVARQLTTSKMHPEPVCALGQARLRNKVTDIQPKELFSRL